MQIGVFDTPTAATGGGHYFLQRTASGIARDPCPSADIVKTVDQRAGAQATRWSAYEPTDG